MVVAQPVEGKQSCRRSYRQKRSQDCSMRRPLYVKDGEVRCRLGSDMMALRIYLAPSVFAYTVVTGSYIASPLTRYMIRLPLRFCCRSSEVDFSSSSLGDGDGLPLSRGASRSFSFG